MARALARNRPLGTIAHRIRVERVPPSFTRSASLSQLDLPRVARAARVTVEVGYLASGHCRQLVRATVRRGMVVRLDIEPCASPTDQRPPRELANLVRQAHRVARRRGRPRPFRPMPLARFRSQAARIVIETITCFKICIFNWCIYCCTTSWGGLVCGSGVVVLPPIIIDF